MKKFKGAIVIMALAVIGFSTTSINAGPYKVCTKKNYDYCMETGGKWIKNSGYCECKY
jgi:hypothetical protein